MNQITTKQNLKEHIELLAAQRNLYSKSKKILTIRSVIVFIFMVFGFFHFDNKILSAYVALASITYLFLDMFWLEKIEKNYRKTAAGIQELFDTKILELDWNSILIPEKPDHELIFEALNDFKKSMGDFSKLIDWYPTDVSRIELKTARAICQRSNIVWDSKQRKGLLKWIVAVLVIQTIVAIIIGINFQVSASTLLVSIILPLLPAYNFLLKLIVLHYDTLNMQITLKKEAEKLINISLDASEQSMCFHSRMLQNEIYNHRKECLPIPDWFYFIIKKDNEDEMYYNVSAKLKEIQK